MVLHPLSSASERTSRRVLAVVLAVVVLGGLVVGPAVTVSAQPAAPGTSTPNTTTTSTNATTTTNASSPASSAVSDTTSPPANASQNATQPANATNTSTSTNARAGGNTSRLSAGASTGATESVSGSTSLTTWVKDLAEMNASQAQQAVENNPRKADQMAKALGRLGVENPNQTVQQQPRQTARRVAGVLSAGNASSNTTAQNNSSAGGQVQLRKCSGGGFIDSAMCKASNALFGWVIGGVVDFVQGIITGIVSLIVGTPVPKHDGSPAFFQQPTNQPWTGVYNSWLTFALPLGILEWVLMMLGIMFSQVYISGSSNELKRREMKNRSWKVLLGVLGSWAIGSMILHLSNGITLAVAPDGEQIANNLAVFTGSVGAAGAAGLLIWFFEGILFLFVLLLVLSKYAVVFVMMWSLPILLPLAAFDVGPIKLLSKPARGIIDMFIPFVFLTLPMALVLRVGYVVVNSLNQGSIAQIGMWASGSNTALILGFWIMAAVSPLFVFSQTGRIKGMAAGMLGASIATSNVKEKVQDAKQRVDTNPPPNVNETTNINARKNEGTHGGPLPGGGNDKRSMLEAGTQPDRTEAGSPMSTADGPELLGPGDDSMGPSASGGRGSTSTSTGQTTNTNSGAASGTASVGSDTGSDDMVSPGEVTQVNHPRDLPTGNYRIGHIKDNGEFQPMRNNGGLSRTALLNGRYERLNRRTDRYEDENLVIQSKEDGTYFDMDPMTYREQSYERMSEDTSEDVLNS